MEVVKVTDDEMGDKGTVLHRVSWGQERLVVWGKAESEVLFNKTMPPKQQSGISQRKKLG